MANVLLYTRRSGKGIEEMKLTIKNLMAVMEDLNEVDKESYDELWHAMQVLHNLDLVEEKFVKAMVKKDRELWEIENVENA